MGSRVVALRLDDETLELIGEIVRAGAEKFSGIAGIVEAVEELFELEKGLGDIPVRLDGALKRLLDDREGRP
jgi:hypothetical protein